MMVARCARCDHDERAHEYAVGTDPDSIAVIVALGGPCARFAVPRARLAARRPGTGRGRVCGRCGGQGHARENCPI
jgi:hypothetical protein